MLDELATLVKGSHLLVGFLLLFAHALYGLPGYAVTDWLATSTENWEWVQPRIISEDLLQVIARVDVVHALERLALLLKILDRCLVLGGELDMELKEGSYEHADHAGHHKS